MAELDKKKITESLENLQLEETQERVNNIRSAREGRKRRAAALQQTILRTEMLIKARQDNCWHKKGGKGVEALSQGNDANFAVIKHQLCHGPVIVICQRCFKLWEPPLRPAKGASADDKAKYREDLMEYNRALNLPTDNLASGTQLFVLTQNETAA